METRPKTKRPRQIVAAIEVPLCAAETARVYGILRDFLLNCAPLYETLRRRQRVRMRTLYLPGSTGTPASTALSTLSRSPFARSR